MIMRTYNSKKEIQEVIRKQITTNDFQAVKAMLRIYEYQTADEKVSGGVVDNNGVGFAGTDSTILTSFCHQFQKCGTLSDKQIALVKKKIGKYAGQLVNQAIDRGLYTKQDNVWVVATV